MLLVFFVVGGCEMNQPRWLTWLLVTLAAVALFFVCHCGGSEGGELFSPSISPTTDGGLSEDPLAGSDGARGPGLDATVVGETRGEGGELPPVDGTPDSAASDAPFPRDVTQDPWPEDVVVERMPAPNCFVDPQGQTACCFPRNQPPVYCEIQNLPHFCEACPR